MKIHVLCNDGSPIGVTLKDLWGEGNRGIGVGGSEYALLTMCEAWHNAGHEVVLFNNPMTEYGSPFEQRMIHSFVTTEDRDVLINFRSPNTRTVVCNNCLKVWWSCDQYTIGDYAAFSHSVDKIVCISDFHAQYFAANYGIHGVAVIDLPVRVQDLTDTGEVQKVPKKVLFSSVPDRGLHYLYSLWGAIKDRCKDINLTITSDYRLWGVTEGNQQHREAWARIENVRFLGAIPRKQLIQEELESQILAYPCIYDELFCISVAEAQCAGVYPVTSHTGALRTTNMGKLVNFNPAIYGEFGVEFIESITNLLSGNASKLAENQEEVQLKAIARFHPDNIMYQWDKKIFNGG